MRLRELVYADDICLLASSPEQLQALIDALAAYCATLQMEMSVPKTKVMVVSAVPAPALGFTCDDNPVEQVATLNPWDFIFINQAPLRTLSNQSKRGLAVLGRLVIYDYYLRTFCRLSPSTPCRLLLTELGLLPLQVFWWRQTLQFWNSWAVVPVGSLYHTVCWTALPMPFGGLLAIWLAHWQNVCIQWVLRCLTCMIWCPVRCGRCCGGSD